MIIVREHAYKLGLEDGGELLDDSTCEPAGQARERPGAREGAEEEAVAHGGRPEAARAQQVDEAGDACRVRGRGQR